VLYLILAGLLLNPDLPLEGDSPIFFNLAQSIASGVGYKDIYFPDNPDHIQYPHGYPGLLAMVIILFPKTIVGLKLLSILFGAASLIVIQILFSNRCKTHSVNLKTFYLSLITLLTVTNLWFLSFSVILLPEMFYFFFSLLTLVISKVYFKQKNLVNKYLWLLIFCLGLTFYTKAIGISLLLAITVYLFFIMKDSKKGFLILGWGVFLIVLWIKFLLLIPSKSSPSIISQNYITQLFSDNAFSFSPMIKLVLSNLSGYFQSISSLFLPVYFLGEETFEARRYCFLLYSLINEINFFNLQSFLFFSRVLIISIGSVTCFGFLQQFKYKDLNEIYVTCYLLVLLFSSKGVLCL
jgi:4-amino-4-deoxy-L-arabinose transferase-like glycosyltransferase